MCWRWSSPTVGLVEEHVRHLQYRIREEPDRDELLLLGFVLELGHPPQLAEAGDGRQQPSRLGMVRVVALDEEGAAVRLETRGEKKCSER